MKKALLQSNRKAQLFTIDLILGIFIFLLTVVAMFSMWDLYLGRFKKDVIYDENFIKALHITDNFVKTPGYPINWNSQNVEVIGLATENRNLLVDKVKNLTSMSIDEAKKILNIENQNFYFAIVLLNGSVIEKLGKKELTTHKNKIKIRRPVIYDGKEAMLEFELWEK